MIHGDVREMADSCDDHLEKTGKFDPVQNDLNSNEMILVRMKMMF
jgi:hypothetical protein